NVDYTWPQNIDTPVRPPRTPRIPVGLNANVAKLASLLPDGIQLSDYVYGGSGMTVAARLSQLRATARNGVIYDGSGKEIKFYLCVAGGAAMDWNGMWQRTIDFYTQQGYTVIAVPERNPPPRR